MIELLARLFARHDTPEDRLIRMAIDAIVAGTDPRLRAAAGVDNRLREPARTAICYVRQLADRLGPAVELSAAVYGSDPRVRALFGSVDSMRQIIARDTALRTFEREAGHQAGDEVFALLLAERRLKHVLGMDLQGEVVMRDLAKTLLVFSKHRLRAVAASEAASGRAMRILAFRQLVAAARRRVEDARAGRPADLDAGQTDDPVVADMTARLRRSGPSALVLDDYLVLVARVLAQPGRQLPIRTFTATVDRMGAMVEDATTRSDADRITLWELARPDGDVPTIAIRVRLRPTDFPQPMPEVL